MDNPPTQFDGVVVGNCGRSNPRTNNSGNIQINHAGLVEYSNPFRLPMEPANLPQMLDWSTATGTYLLNSLITREAATIAYLNDFKMIMYITMAAVPLLLLMKKSNP